MATGTTTSKQMVIPEVMGDMIDAKLPNKLRFSALAKIDDSLEGKPGDTLTVPRWDYIGDAEDFDEGDTIDLAQLTTSETKLTIKSIAKGAEITDRSMLTGLGDPIGTAANQISLAMANKMDNDFIAAADTAKLTVVPATAGKITLADLKAAKRKLKNEDTQTFTFITTEDAAYSLLDEFIGTGAGSEAAAAALANATNAVVAGSVGRIYGVDIFISGKVVDGVGYLVQTTEDAETGDQLPAFMLLKKRGVQVETDRDILKKTTVITGDTYYGAYLYDATKVVRIGTTTTP